MKEYVTHVVENGSHKHVISWIGYKDTAFELCSEKNCEINKEYDEEVRDKK